MAMNIAIVCLSSASDVAKFDMVSKACTSVSESCPPVMMLFSWKPVDLAV